MQNNEINYKCCFTGYRPSKFNFKLNESDPEFIKFENSLIDNINTIIADGCSVFYTGMAMGFDIIAAQAVILLKKAKYGDRISLISVLPFEAQAEGFSFYWQNKYKNIIENCDEKIVISKDYHKGCYSLRNKFMVDKCDIVLTWYDGRAGGTRNTLNYATLKNRKIININDKKSDDFNLQTAFELF